MAAHSTPRTGNPWLYLPRPVARPRARLFCFPYAGGNAMAFRGWAEGLPADVELCAVQLPGRGSRFRERAITRLGALLDELERALAPGLDVPFALFGHSMGALIAYELACRLRDRGGPAPVHLFLSGRSAPGLPPSEPPASDLPDAEFLDRLRRYGGTPEEVLAQPELMELLLPVLRADFTLIETWKDAGHAPLDVPFSVLGGLEDAGAGRDRLEGWRARTRSEFALRMLPGNHFFIQSAEATVLRILADALAPSHAAPPPRGDTGGHAA